LGKEHAATVFFDVRALAWNLKDRTAFLATTRVLAHMQGCDGTHWEIRSESIGKGQVGLIAYTSTGKAIASGIGKLGSQRRVHLSLKTLYPRITNDRKVEVDVNGEGEIGASGADWQLAGGVKISF
jgi:hypothetical protein